MTTTADLQRILAGVRRRYRLRVLLAAALKIGLGLLALLMVSAWILEWFRFDATAAVVLRVVFYLALGGMVLRWIILPLRRPIADLEIALYIEEHEPTLEAALVSAVAVEGQNPAAVSPGLARVLVMQAVHRARAVEDGRRIERRPLRWLPVALAGTVGLALLMGFAGPGFMRNAFRVLLLPWSSAEAANPYVIVVEPGNALVARGGDLEVNARLIGFETDLVMLSLRRTDSLDWESIAMGSDSGGRYVARLFDLDQTLEYQVEANGLRSPVFRVEVRDLPYTRRLDLEYRFPGYTGLASETVTDGGDIAVVRGTRVYLRVTPTMPVVAGRLLIEGEDPIPLTPTEGTLEATFQVSRNGFYRIELQAAGSPMVPASLNYTIETLEDHPPSVQVTRPGRDSRATSIEEVFIEAQADDDYGVRDLELVYRINGGEEKVVALHAPPRLSRREVTAAHTLFLEEFTLDPGDIVSYYARARDGNPFGGPGVAVTDIYFIQVRPFDREYREAEQAGMPGEAQDSPQGLSEQQRQIVSATFKADRDRASTPATDFQENLATITLAQGRLRDRASVLAEQIASRGVAATDSTYAIVETELRAAAVAMQQAEVQLTQVRAAEALPPEQQALQHLLRAEAAFREVQVAQGQQQGGSPGGQESNIEELADLFELENDRLQNQYETVQRGRNAQARQELDEVLERLKELAARQQLENERMRREAERMQQNQSSSASGGGATQRRLAAEADSLARRLERLSREQPTPELQESLQDLQQAVDAMRRSAAQGNQSQAQAERALARLEEARRSLEAGNAERLRNQVNRLADAAGRLAQEQRDIAEAAQTRAPTDQAERRRIEQRKERLAEAVSGLGEDLDQAILDARRDAPEAARAMQEASNRLRDRRLAERIRYSRGLLNSPEASRSFEAGITGTLEEVTRQLENAAESVGQEPGAEAERALENLQQLTRGMESLADRIQQNPGTGEGGDPRQVQRELRARTADAEQVRRDLQQRGVDPQALDRMIGQMRNLGSRGSDSASRVQLLAELVQGLKDLEFQLRRDLLGAQDVRPRAGRPGEVPPGYRDLVDRYYESLAE